MIETINKDLQKMHQVISIGPLTNVADYYKKVQDGISGEEFKNMVSLVGNRTVFASAMSKVKSNLSRSYRVKKLPLHDADNALDTYRIYMQAVNIYGSLELAREWLDSPIPALGGEVPNNMMATHAGRELVRQALNKIEYGEYA